MHIKAEMTIKETINKLNHAQTQTSIYRILEKSGYLNVVLRFMIDHYNSVFNKSYRAWSKPTSYQPTDLNDARNMSVEALKWLRRIRTVKFEVSSGVK